MAARSPSHRATEDNQRVQAWANHAGRGGECGGEGLDARMTPWAKLGLSPFTLVLDQDAKASWPTSCTKANDNEHVDPAVANRHQIRSE